MRRRPLTRMIASYLKAVGPGTTTPVVYVAQRLRVSPQTIRRWMRRIGLPMGRPGRPPIDDCHERRSAKPGCGCRWCRELIRTKWTRYRAAKRQAAA